MGKQDIYIRSKEITNHRIGNDGTDVKIFFNVPDEDEDEEYNDAILVEGNYSSYPIVNIDDAIKTLKEAKEKGCNFVHIYEHGDHGEINFEGYLIEKLTDEEVAEYKAEEERKKLEKIKNIEDAERKKYEELKNKFG